MVYTYICIYIHIWCDVSGWVRTEAEVFECGKDLFSCVLPLESNFRRGEVGDRESNFAKAANELAIKVCKPKEVLKVLPGS